jgi:hypothetical protein
MNKVNANLIEHFIWAYCEAYFNESGVYPDMRGFTYDGLGMVETIEMKGFEVDGEEIGNVTLQRSKIDNKGWYIAF